MSTAMDRIALEALDMPKEFRADLAYRLLVSLEDKLEPSPDVLDHWTTEADRRMTEIDSGQVRCIPADEVLREMREKFG
jgi:hypothetical protein